MVRRAAEALAGLGTTDSRGVARRARSPRAAESFSLAVIRPTFPRATRPRALGRVRPIGLADDGDVRAGDVDRRALAARAAPRRRRPCARRRRASPQTTVRPPPRVRVTVVGLLAPMPPTRSRSAAGSPVEHLQGGGRWRGPAASGPGAPTTSRGRSSGARAPSRRRVPAGVDQAGAPGVGGDDATPTRSTTRSSACRARCGAPAPAATGASAATRARHRGGVDAGQRGAEVDVGRDQRPRRSTAARCPAPPPRAAASTGEDSSSQASTPTGSRARALSAARRSRRRRRSCFSARCAGLQARDGRHAPAGAADRRSSLLPAAAGPRGRPGSRRRRRGSGRGRRAGPGRPAARAPPTSWARRRPASGGSGQAAATVPPLAPGTGSSPAA